MSPPNFDNDVNILAAPLARAQAALAESEKNFRQIAETIQEVFWISSPEGEKIYYVSPAYETIWGRTAASLYANPVQWSDAVHPEDRARLKELLISKARGHYEAEYRIVRPDGSVRWIRDRGFPVTEADGTISRMIGIARDINDQKILTQQLNQSQKLEAIGRLAAGVSHDFNNMLTAIIGYAQMLELSLPADDARRADLKEIQVTGDRAAHLTRQLLAFSRQQVMEPQVVPMNGMFLEMKNMLQRLIGEDIEIIEKLDAGAGLVNVDPGQFGQVILNLFVNARDAMPDGGRLIVETRASDVDAAKAAMIGSVDPGPYAVMEITDTGCGISKIDIPKIFEPFFTTKPVGMGTGLGLSTVYGIIRQCGGAISVYSEVGVGTTFRIFLPRAQSSKATYEGKPAEKTEVVDGAGRILLVEDEPAVQKLAIRLLKTFGYSVVSVRSPDEALAAVQSASRPFDLLLTDVILPGMNGKQLADQIRVSTPGIRTLFMSGYTDEAIAHKGLLDPGLHFLSKPFSAVTLSNKVKDVLSG